MIQAGPTELRLPKQPRGLHAARLLREPGLFDLLQLQNRAQEHRQQSKAQQPLLAENAQQRRSLEKTAVERSLVGRAS